MNTKDYTKNVIFKVLLILKPLLLTFAVIVVLQTTGLLSTVSYAGHWMILQSGLKDASDEKDEAKETFDYNFTIKDLNGKKIDFTEFKGKVVFLNLWATWCGPCRAEMASIQNLYNNLGKDKAVFVMLSLDRDSDHQKIVDYINKKAFTFNVYQPSGFLPKQLQVPAIPTTFIISPDGKIARKEVGGMRYDTAKFQKFLEGLSSN